MNRGGEPAKIALGLLKLTVPIEERTTGQAARPYGKTEHGRIQGDPFHLGKMTAALTGGA